MLAGSCAVLPVQSPRRSPGQSPEAATVIIDHRSILKQRGHSSRKVLDYRCLRRCPDTFGTPRRAMFEENRANVPLAERLRPRTIDEVIGQKHLLGHNTT